MSEYTVKLCVLARGEFDVPWLTSALESNDMRPKDPAEAELWRIFYASPRDTLLEAIYDAQVLPKRATPNETELRFVVRLQDIAPTDAERVLELAVGYAGHRAIARVHPTRPSPHSSV